ncbi:MAG TPA: methyl-accepting chemotaxis protein [Bacillota bacterium]|nr:methyl-accepting chemotaxis protein [Bacillota bacterium]
MKSFFRKISELIRVIRLIKPQELRDRLDEQGVIQQFTIILGGFTLIIALLVILGFTIPTVINAQMGLNYRKLSAEITAVSRIEVNLAELQLIGNESYSGLTPRIPDDTLMSLNKDLQTIKPYLKSESRQSITTGLSTLRDLLSKPVTDQGYQDIQTENKKINNYLNEAKTSLGKLQSSSMKVKLWFLLAHLSILTILALLALVFWIRLTLQIVDKHERAIQGINRVASQFNEGQLNLIIMDYPNQDYRNLKAGFTAYLQSYNTKIHSIKTQVNEIVAPLKSLSNMIRQNNINHQDLKNKLQEVINKTYHKLDFVPEIADRIKTLNSNLTESQQKVNNIQKFMEDSIQAFQTNIQHLEDISTEFIQKDTYSKEMISYFRTLSKILDSTQHIVTIFGSIADQTTVLSLNASIEAARVGTTDDDGFNVAATQIDELADRIRVIPHELTNMINKVRKKMEIVVRSYEHSRFSFHKNPGVKYVDSIKNGLNLFWNDLNQDLQETQEVGVLIQIFAEKQKALEELTAFLAQLNRQIPASYKKATATLESVEENQRVPDLINRLIQVLVELNQALDQI